MADPEAKQSQTVAEILVAARQREAELYNEVADLKAEIATLLQQKQDQDKTSFETLSQLHGKIIKLSQRNNRYLNTTNNRNDDDAIDDDDGDNNNNNTDEEKSSKYSTTLPNNNNNINTTTNNNNTDAADARDSLAWFQTQIATKQAEQDAAARSITLLQDEVAALQTKATQNAKNAALAESAMQQAEALEGKVAELKKNRLKLAADRNSYKRKLESLQKDTRKLIAAKLQIESGLRELREARKVSAELDDVQVRTATVCSVFCFCCSV